VTATDSSGPFAARPTARLPPRRWIWFGVRSNAALVHIGYRWLWESDSDAIQKQYRRLLRAAREVIAVLVNGAMVSVQGLSAGGPGPASYCCYPEHPSQSLRSNCRLFAGPTTLCQRAVDYCPVVVILTCSISMTFSGNRAVIASRMTSLDLLLPHFQWRRNHRLRRVQWTGAPGPLGFTKKARK